MKFISILLHLRYFGFVLSTVLLFTACTDDIEHKIEGQWQLKTIEKNGMISPVDTVFYNFMNGRVFSITVLQPQELINPGNTRDHAYTFYGYIDELAGDNMLITIHNPDDGFKEATGWNEGQRIFDIVNITNKNLMLRTNEQLYSFKKH
ncbi:MAG: lipocalin-like domain-containing protein [Candidatus Symbiothrix sp.]|jgi:hypothetical protein|nr:lipocalin-like domain-containing protein [Candidatus Symbiothrix sp.]